MDMHYSVLETLEMDRCLGTEMSMGKGSVTARSTGTPKDTTIGQYFANKYRTQAKESSYHQAARNLRKQGVPLNVARLILFGK